MNQVTYRTTRAPFCPATGGTTALALWLWRRGQGGWLPRIAILVVLQVALGIATLVMQVPLSVALGHQALAFMLAGAITAWLADMRPRSMV